jgi:hypothetical protein
VCAQTYSSSAPVATLRGRGFLIFIFFGVWIISGLYMYANLYRGWIPHDEGTYAQAAERVLDGELPHRDFEDHYTGGLSFLHALGFRLFGTTLGTMRIILFIFFLLWVPAVFFIASRFASPPVSAAITLLAVAWSVPNYAAAVPSWYNLYLLTFGILALFQYLESQRSGWIVLAGLFAGLSVLVKITGLYFIAAVLLFFIYLEQSREPSANLSLNPSPKRGRLYTIFISISLFLFAGFLLSLIRKTSGPTYVVHFFLPGAMVAVYLLSREFQQAHPPDSQRFLALSKTVLPFLISLSLPIGIYAVPYLRSYSLHSLIRGVFVLPQLHFKYTSIAPPGFSALGPTLLLAAILAFAILQRGLSRWIYASALAVLAVWLLVQSASNENLYVFIWDSTAFLIPLLILSGIALLLRSNAPSSLFSKRFMLLLCVLALWTVVQIPFAAAIYFCFVAPVLILALLAFFSELKIPHQPALFVLLGFYLLFVVLRVTPTFIIEMGEHYRHDTQTVQLDLPRAGGLRISEGNALVYEQLVPLIQQHASGQYIYAAPDCPEVYFLSGYRNPTPTLFDFFDDPASHDASVLEAVDQHGVKVIAIFKTPAFSKPIDGLLLQKLEARYPNSASVGRFDVRWRE